MRLSHWFSTLSVLLAVVLLAAAPAHATPKLGLQAWTFNKLTLTETIERASELKVRYLQAYPGQEVGGGISGKMGPSLTPDAVKQLLAFAKARNVTIESFGVITLKPDGDWEGLFKFARSAGIKEIVTEAPRATLVQIAPLAKKYRIQVSLHNHPEPNIYGKAEKALAAVEGLDKRFGICADTGHWARSGYDPVQSLRLVEKRLRSLHFKDIAERGKRSRDVPWGTGTSDLAGQLAYLRQIDFDGIAYIEYEHYSPALVEEVARCVDYFRRALEAPRAELAVGKVAPAGYSRNVTEAINPERAKTSKHWPAAQPLFQTDLSNAEMKPGAWAFSPEGVLSPTRAPDAKANGDIWTKESYGDFALTLEFRTKEQTNSGVFLRSSDIVKWLHNSIEVQILQGDAANPTHVVGSIFDVLAPKRQVPIKPGTWHRYRIVANKAVITVFLDSEEVTKIDLNEWTQPGVNPDGTKNKFEKAYKDMAREGRIGLQDHGDSKIEFRNLYIERL